MSHSEGLDWLADDEGNLRPEAAQVLEAAPELGEVVRPDPPREVQSAGRWASRGSVVLGALWIFISFIEWVFFLCFVVGLLVRLSRWSERERGGSAARGQRSARTAVRRPAESIPLHGRGYGPPRDPDPVMPMEE